MYNITSPLANLPGKPLNIIHTGSEEKWVKAPNKPKHAVYVASTGGGKLHIVGNINAKSVYIDKGVKVYGSITAETDIRLSTDTELIARTEYPLVAGGNIIIGEPSYGGDPQGDRTKLYLLGGLLAGGDLFIGEDVELNTCQVIVGGDIILGAYSSIELHPIEREKKPLPLEPKYLCGGQIYMHPKTHYSPISLNKATGWSNILPYNKDTPSVCLKNGAHMRAGGERISCASTTIYSNELKNPHHIILPAPDAEQAELYTAPIGLPPAYKAQAKVHRNTCLLTQMIYSWEPLVVTDKRFAHHIENNLENIITELSHLAQVRPEMIENQAIRTEYEVAILGVAKSLDRRYHIKEADLMKQVCKIAQAVADIDSKYLDEPPTEPEEKGLKTWFKSLF